MELIILTSVVVFFLTLNYFDKKKRSKTNKQVNSFSEMSCSDDSGVVNITITSSR